MRQRQGFTLIELLVVISIIAILAALLVPTIAIVREQARKAETTNNMKSIVGATIAYTTNFDGSMPSLTTSGNIATIEGTTAVANAKDCAGVTAKVFMLIAKDGDIPPKVFSNPNNARKPNSKINRTATSIDFGKATTGDITALTKAEILDSGDTGDSGWWESFAFDWGAPSTANSSSRVLVGDREPGNWGNKGICVAYGDGHGGFVKAKGSNTPTTVNSLGDANTNNDYIISDLGTADSVYFWADQNGQTTEAAYTEVKFAGYGRSSATMAWIR